MIGSTTSLLLVFVIAFCNIIGSGSAELGNLRMSGSKGVALDIDGVLYRSGTVFPRTAEAMKLLESSKIPYVFVTNGGGLTEIEKSRELTQQLGVNVRPEQIIMAHTPFKQIAEQHKEQRVLIIGHEGCLDVARSYGFSKVACVRDLHEEFPSVYNHRIPMNLPSSTEIGEPIEAILLFHDCIDWGLEMQVMWDVLVGRQQNNYNVPDNEVLKQRIPVFACNADIVSPTMHPSPRFTQGAFVHAFKALFEIYSGGEKLIVNTCGKPFKVQYDYATKLLAAEAALQGLESVTQYYGVGDNPKSDIRGANSAGEKWTSVLVRTGVFTGVDNDAVDPADVVVYDVLDAVKYIIADGMK